MRVVDSATWTSGEPVSLSARLCSAISLPLTSVSIAKPSRNYTEAGLSTVLGRPLDRPVRARVGSSSPRPRSVDEDRVRVAKRVMFWRHELDVQARAAQLSGARVV